MGLSRGVHCAAAPHPGLVVSSYVAVFALLLLAVVGLLTGACRVFQGCSVVGFFKVVAL
jgi:hypothetical protein